MNVYSSPILVFLGFLLILFTFFILAIMISRYIVKKKFKNRNGSGQKFYIWSGNVYMKFLTQNFGSGPFIGALCFNNDILLISGIRSIFLNKQDITFEIKNPSNPLVSRIVIYHTSQKIYKFYTLKTELISNLLLELEYVKK